MIIYLITNTVNGKKYVGQHCGTTDSRWKQHLQAALKLEDPKPLYASMRKYGIENFKYEVLEVLGKDADGNDLYSGEVLAAFDNILTAETKEILMSQKVLDEVNDLDISLEQYLKKDKSVLKQMITNDIINYFT